MPSKQKWKSLSTYFERRIRSPREAERALKQFIAETGHSNATLQWKGGRPQAVWQDHGGPATSIVTFINDYLERQRDRVTAETHRHLRTYLAYFLEWCADQGFRNLADIDRRSLEQYVSGAPGGPRTKAHYLNSARAALNVAMRWRLIPYNPAAGIPAPVDRRTKARRCLTDDEIRIIAADWPSPEREFALIGIWAGLRLGELRHLAWADIDLSAATIAITAKPEFGFSPKGTRYRDGRPDVVPIVPWLVELMQAICQQAVNGGWYFQKLRDDILASCATAQTDPLHDPTRSLNEDRPVMERLPRFVFDRGDDHPLWSDWTWQKRIARAAEASGMSHVSPHVFRHTFCTKLALAGVNRAVWGTLARHLDPKTTDQYIHATLDDARRELARLEPVERHV